MMNSQISTSNEGEDNFNFDNWIIQHDLVEVKELFVKHNVITIEALKLTSIAFQALMTDHALFSKSHTIPKIMNAMQTMSTIKVVIGEDEQEVIDKIAENLKSIDKFEVVSNKLSEDFPKSISRINNEKLKQIDVTINKVNKTFDDILNAVKRKKQSVLNELNDIKSRIKNCNNDNNDNDDEKDVDVISNIKDNTKKSRQFLQKQSQKCDQLTSTNENRLERKQTIINIGKIVKEKYNKTQKLLNDNIENLNKSIQRNNDTVVNIDFVVNNKKYNKTIQYINGIGMVINKEYNKTEKKEDDVEQYTNGKELMFMDGTVKRNVLKQNVSLNTNKRYKPPLDAFIVNGTNLRSYVQLFKQKERTIDDIKSISCETKEQLIAFFQKLNNNYVIQWSDDFSHEGRDILCQALTPKIYDKFLKDKQQLQDQKLFELNEERLKTETKNIIAQRKKEIQQEFFNLYINSEGMRATHKQIKNIVNDLSDNIQDDLVKEVDLYVHMKQEKTTLPDLPYTVLYWRDQKVRALVNDTQEIMNKHKTNVTTINHTFYRTMRRIEKKKKPKENSQQSKAMQWITNEDNEKDKQLVIMTDKQWNEYKDKMKTDARWEKDNQVKSQLNFTIQNWCNAFVNRLDEYKYWAYKREKYGSLIHTKTVKDKIKEQIDSKYRTLSRHLRQKLYQNFNSKQKQQKPLKIATMNKLIFTPNKWKTSAKYDLKYITPNVIPPTYDMEFVCIDLPTLEVMKNMRYEMQQNHDLLFHYMMKNGDVIMFIRGDNEDTKTSETEIVISHQMTLKPEQKVKVLRKKKVLKVAFCEEQKMFAILFENRLAFAILQENIRVAFTNKGCDLQDMAWFDHNTEFDAMLMQEIDKRLYVWFVDKTNYIRAFDVDTNDWDKAKEFRLDQNYASIILSQEKSFLMAFKPQYEENEMKEKQMEKKVPTGRIQLHAFSLIARKKLTYKIHSKSLTGYEIGNEPQMTEDNKDILDMVDNVLLPKIFDMDKIQLNRLMMKKIKDTPVLCTITSDNQLLLHSLHIQYFKENSINI